MSFNRQSKKKLSKKELESILPAIRDFNGIANKLIKMLGQTIQKKEGKINVLVAKIGRPIQDDSHVKVMNVDMSKGFLKNLKKTQKKPGDSDYDSNFTQRKGFVI